MSWRTMFVTCLVLTALVGCVERNTVGSDGHGIHPALAAAIEVTATGLDFETLAEGEWSTKTLKIRSVGAGVLHLEDLTIEGASSFTIVDDDTEYAVAPGDETTVEVHFGPQVDGELLGVLHIVSNDHDRPDVAVALMGAGRAPRIQINPTNWDFGEVEAGCTRELYLAIRNIGSEDLILDEVAISSTSDEFHYELEFFEGALLYPQTTVSAIITYEPRDEMPDSAYLHIQSNDPFQPEAMAVQRGVGQLANPIVDEFVQTDSVGTDILWVVDNSCSMSDDHNSLANNFSAFLDVADVFALDYHLGIVTTDDASLQGAIPIMTPNTPDVHAAFAAAVTVGTMGSGTEMGFLYGWGALSSPMTDPGGPNDGFLRDNANLHVIFVSDEAEQSPETVTDYVNYFTSLKANPASVILSCIIEQSYGQRYEQAATMTGGLVEYLSNPNWISAMSQVAWMSISEGYFFPLSEIPVEGTVQVWLNGVPIYEGWSVDHANNAVVFDMDHVPNPEDLISVIYNPVGDC